MERDVLKRSAAGQGSDAAPGRADRRRGPSAGSRWRCRAGPWECRRRGFSSGAPEIGHRVGNGGRRWRRRSRYLSANHSGTYGSPRIDRGPARYDWRVSKSTRRDVDGRGGCGGSPKTPAARYGHTGQIRRKAPDGLRRDFTPDAAAGRALVPGSHRNPHRRRQTPLATVLDLYSRRSDRYPTLDGALCPAHAQRGMPPPVIRPSVSQSSGLTTPCRSTWLAHTNVFAPQALSFDKRSGGQRGGADRRRCRVWRPLRFWPMGARRVGVSVSWGVLRNTRRNLPI